MRYQRETLVAELRKRGIRYLAPSDAIATETITTESELIGALLEQPDPRLQMALVPLFIRNPELAFHFDLYSVALSKIERGTGEDISDVLALLQNGHLEMANLLRYFNEILPQFGTASLKRDPDEFQRKFDAFTQMWQAIN